MRENTEQKNSEYGHFSCIARQSETIHFLLKISLSSQLKIYWFWGRILFLLYRCMLYATGPRKITKTNKNQIEPKQNKPKLKAKQPTKKKLKKVFVKKGKKC